MNFVAPTRLLLTSVVAVFLAAAPAITEARTKQLQPVFIVQVPNASAVQTETVLRRSLAGRHWTITRDVPNEIEARLVVRDHSITAKFAWAATQVFIVYVASENMDYEVDGDKTYIDRYYYRWLKLLQRDIVNYSKRAGYITGAITQDPSKDDDAADDDAQPSQKAPVPAGK